MSKQDQGNEAPRRSSTTFEHDGFVIDLNRLTRQEYNDWRRGRKDTDEIEKDLFDAKHMLEKVIVEWPFPQPVTLDGYMALGFADSLVVDRMVGKAVNELRGKESAG